MRQHYVKIILLDPFNSHGSDHPGDGDGSGLNYDRGDGNGNGVGGGVGDFEAMDRREGKLKVLKCE